MFQHICGCNISGGCTNFGRPRSTLNMCAPDCMGIVSETSAGSGVAVQLLLPPCHVLGSQETHTRLIVGNCKSAVGLVPSPSYSTPLSSLFELVPPCNLLHRLNQRVGSYSKQSSLVTSRLSLPVRSLCHTKASGTIFRLVLNLHCEQYRH